MKKVLLCLVLAFSSIGWAQTFTLVTGTVTDPNGLPYAFGTIAATLSQGTPFFTGTQTQYMPPQQASGLDSSGKFSVRLADVTQLTPGGFTWSFKVCSAAGTVLPSFGKGPVCFSVSGISISGSSQDIGATLTAAAPALTANFGSSSSVSGSGTTNTLPIWTGANSLGNSQISQSGGGIVFTGGLNAPTSRWGNYAGQQSVGNGMAQTVGVVSGSQVIGGNMTPTTIIANTPTSDGTSYLLMCYEVIKLTTAASSTLPLCQVSWTDAQTGTVETQTFGATNTANTVGAMTFGMIFLDVAQNTGITVSTSGFAQSGGTMDFIPAFLLSRL